MPGHSAFAPSPARLGFMTMSAAAPPMSAGPPPVHAAAVVSNPPPSSVRVVPRSTPLMSSPPHRRAQVILEKMAGLTSRLAELGGSKAWHGVSGKTPVHTFLPGATITPEAAAATTTKELLSMIEAHQELLFEAIEEITKLQEIEQEKQRIAEQIASRDSVMREFAKRLRDAEQVLEYTLEDYEDYRRPKRRGDAGTSQGVVGLGTIDVKELVAYAHRISYTIFAPPEYATGQVALRGALPPAPQEEQMRASQLYHAADMDLGLPKPSTSADTLLEVSKLKAESPQMSSTLRLPAGVPLPQFHQDGDRACLLSFQQIYRQCLLGGSLEIPFLCLQAWKFLQYHLAGSLEMQSCYLLQLLLPNHWIKEPQSLPRLIWLSQLPSLV